MRIADIDKSIIDMLVGDENWVVISMDDLILQNSEVLDLREKVKELEKSVKHLTGLLALNRGPDSLYGGLYISDEHLESWSEEYPTQSKAAISLIEEMSELQQAVCKRERGYLLNGDNIVEEMAHVLISLKGYSQHLYLMPDEIQDEFRKKCPEGYL